MKNLATKNFAFELALARTICALVAASFGAASYLHALASACH